MSHYEQAKAALAQADRESVEEGPYYAAVAIAHALLAIEERLAEANGYHIPDTTQESGDA